MLMAGIACLTLLALLVRGEKSHAASSKPNIIMFTTDDQTVRDMTENAWQAVQAELARRYAAGRRN